MKKKELNKNKMNQIKVYSVWESDWNGRDYPNVLLQVGTQMRWKS